MNYLKENLQWLMDKHDIDGQQAMHRYTVQRGFRISQAKIGNIINETQSTSTDIIDRLAATFNLAPWQMLAPPHLARDGETPGLAKLIADYAASDEKGRETIASVADTHARLAGKL